MFNFRKKYLIILLGLLCQYYHTVSGQTVLSLGQNITASWVNPTDVHLYDIPLKPGDHLIVRITSSSIFTSPCIDLVSSNGIVLLSACDPSEARLDYQATQTVTHRLVVYDEGGDDTGAYFLSVQGAALPPNAQPMTCNSTVTADLPIGTAMPAFTVNVVAGTTIRGVLNAKELFTSPAIEIYDENAKLILQASDPTTVVFDQVLAAGGCYTFLLLDEGGNDPSELNFSLTLLAGSCLGACSGLQEICNNGLDDDGDTLVDCDDPDCRPTISISATGNGKLCAGENLQLSASGGQEYRWTGPAGWTSTEQNPQRLATAPSMSGLYSVTVMGSSGCSASEAMTITVYAAPLVTASNNGPVVTGSNVQLTGSGGGSYSWTGPNGFASSIANPLVIDAAPEQAGIYTLLVTNAEGCTATASTEVSVDAGPVGEAVLLQGSRVEGLEGTEVKMPISIMNCSQVTSFQFSLQLEQAGVAEILGVDLTGVQEGFSKMVYNPVNRSCSFVDLSGQGVPAATEEILFYLRLRLSGNPGDSTRLLITSTPLSIEVSCVENGQAAVVPVTTIAGRVVILEDFTISGAIRTEYGAGIAQAQVSYSGATSSGVAVAGTFTTAASGVYRFEAIPAKSTITINCEKEGNPLNGLSSFALFIGGRYILGLAPPLMNSPYRIIAGDVNCDGAFNIQDLLLIQKVIVGFENDFSTCGNWVFVPADHTFTSPFTQSHIFPFPENRSLEVLSDSKLDFIGIKKGDLLGKADPANLIAQELDTRAEESVKWSYSCSPIRAGELIDLQVRSAEAMQLNSVDLALQFDPEQLEWLGLVPSAHLRNVVAGQPEGTVGQVRISWFQLQDAALAVPASEGLFSLRFRARADIKEGRQELIFAGANAIPSIVYDEQLRPLRIELEREETNPSAVSVYRVFPVTPNPFRSQTWLSFSIPEEEKVDIRIFDAIGRELWSYEQITAAGEHRLALSLQKLPEGIYYLVFLAGAFVDQQRIVVGRL